MKIALLFFLFYLPVFAQYGNEKILNNELASNGDNWITNYAGTGLEWVASGGGYSGAWHVTTDANNEGVQVTAAARPGIVSGTTYRFEFSLNITAITSTTIRGSVFSTSYQVQGNYTTTGVKNFSSSFTSSVTGSAYVWWFQVGGTSSEFYLDRASLMEILDTLWIDTNQDDDTDADTTKTLAEAFETRGAHSGGTFIICAGTYAESITIDSSFSKLEASGTASIGAIDFNDKTVTVDLANLTIISKTNDSNVTYLNAPSTSTESGSGYNNWGGFNGYLQSSSGTSTTPTDTTITLAITNSTANSTDSVDVTGTNDLLAFTDSTYWLINQADVAVTWANADEKNSYDGWQSTSTLAHGLASNGYVRVGLAARDVNGDTTAIAQRRHYVNVFTPAEDGALNVVLNTLLH